eukprot:Blabericola_migrator_1__8585@NODE_4493_length_1125_cov_2_833648_g2783_i0_p1_GENE_NODE_4493_length_1125_cov_2_833648_g2783_i0NODE_4493_length_1125_cov_2_833648_g2783_i0_p1_ORF_typecomplete_len354_score79_61FH2/PF02181_23/1_8e36FH2/PF02181_23/9_8e02Prokuma_activ/PF09286_11/0_1FlaC_arch/PF05377_11/7_8e02FlaC_arch/PF05377_11/1e04FlaC_arch/PF05377_11/3_8e02FlaC_arch/PF05377_11/20Phage_HK97_TLTM/PF06120_11/1_2e03Phage_HK97_TLTM/PF06120_11/0_17Cytochrom_B562/PF07361_11/2_1e03Cytochrom_B562/PF07361_11/7
MSIATSRVSKIGLDKLKIAIQNLDPEVRSYTNRSPSFANQIITVDAAETLITYAPTPEEVKSAEAYLAKGGNINDADKAEQFVLMAMTIPNMKEALSAHKFAMEFSLELDSVIVPLEKMKDAVTAIEEAKTFLGLLQLIAQTFRTYNNNIAKAHTELIFNVKPDFEGIMTELAPVKDVTRYELPALEQRMQQIGANYKKLAGNVSAMEQTNSAAAQLLGPFYSAARSQIEDTVRSLEGIKSDCERLMKYFGENEKTMAKLSIQGFFKLIAGFAGTVEAERKLKLEKMEREKKRKEKQAKKASATSAPAKATTPRAEPQQPTKVVSRTADD